jgi:hypothetical protein
MPIIGASERNDARGTARILATAARDCINNPKRAPAQEVALNNVYRLLEAYRTNAFFGLELPVHDSSEDVAETLTLLPPLETHVRDVRVALEKAIAEVFVGVSQDRAIEAIEDVLRAVAYPNQFKKPSIDARTKAASVFEKVHQHLQLD